MSPGQLAEHNAAYQRCAALAKEAERLGRIEDSRIERLAASDEEALAIAEISRALKRTPSGNFCMVPRHRGARTNPMPLRVKTLISWQRVNRLARGGQLAWVNRSHTAAVPVRRAHG